MKIDFNYLIFAYRDASPDNIYYFDTEFGDIQLVHPHLHDLKDLTNELELSHGRFIYIPKCSPEESRQDFHHFLNTVNDSKLKMTLEVGLESPHIDEAFKIILAKYPIELKQLQLFLFEQAQARITNWLKSNGITEIESSEESGSKIT